MSRFAVPLPVSSASLYDYLADPRNRPQWQSSLRRVEAITELAPRVGAEWYDLTWPGLRAHLWISRAEPPAVWAEEASWRGLRASLELRFHAEGRHGTRVEAEVEVRGRGAWDRLARAAGLAAPYAVRADLRRAGTILARRAGQ